MTDLEDRLLKKNIPGKYSWWDEYQDEGSDCGGDRDENDGGSPHQLCSRPAVHDPKTDLPERASRSGVKGVLENYKLDQKEKQRQAWIDRLEKEELLARSTMGQWLEPGQVSISLGAMEERRKQQGRDQDDEFVLQDRERRLKELQEQHVLSFSDAQYDGVEEVDPDGYSQAVDDTDVPLVVHIYETYVPACERLQSILNHLSREFTGARFLSLQASSTHLQLDPVVLPSILVHIDSRLVANLSPVTKDLPADFTPSHVRELLYPWITTVERIPALQAFSSVQDGTDSDAELDEFCKDFTGVH
jgi:hypothetical protein